MARAVRDAETATICFVAPILPSLLHAFPEPTSDRYFLGAFWGNFGGIAASAVDYWCPNEVLFSQNLTVKVSASPDICRHLSGIYPAWRLPNTESQYHEALLVMAFVR